MADGCDYFVGSHQVDTAGCRVSLFGQDVFFHGISLFLQNN